MALAGADDLAHFDCASNGFLPGRIYGRVIIEVKLAQQLCILEQKLFFCIFLDLRQLKSLGVTPNFCKLKVHNRQILQIVDLQDTSINSIMPFHDIDPGLINCLAQNQHIGLDE